MSHPFVDADYLVRRVYDTCENPPPGVVPWRANELLELLDHAGGVGGGRDAFYLAFMEGVHDLCTHDRESAIFRRFSWQALTAEARVLADTESRDHLTHVSQVFLLGWLLLNGTRRFAWATENWLPYGLTLTREGRFQFLNRGWMLASLLHDCAYSVETAREARRHDLLVKALYRDLYQPALPGQAVGTVLRKKAVQLWKHRGAYISVNAAELRDGIKETVDKQLAVTDHGLVTAVALFDEAESVPPPESDGHLAEVLRAASLAIGSHNFQYFFEGEKQTSPWFCLDFWEEPLAALLHLCDELQSWSRERVDEALTRLRSNRVLWAATEITDLNVYGAEGIALDLRLVRRVHPMDRARRPRLVREEERANAATARRLRRLFRPREAQPDFRLHLRVRVSVDDLPCSNELRVDWPRKEAGALEDLDRRWRERSSRVTDLVPCSVQGDDGAILALDARGSVRLEQPSLAKEKPLRLILVGPGGAGKSTFLQALALDPSSFPGVPRVLYVEQLPGRAADLSEELKQLHDVSKSVVLLVDHLDRLEDDPLGAFWLEQLAELPNEAWLHVIAACRTDEFRESVSLVLRMDDSHPGTDRAARFRKATIQGLRAPFVDGEVNSRGDALARGIERKLGGVSDALLRRLGDIALAFGHRRSGALGVPEDLRDLRYRSLGGPPLLLTAASGETRFIHDTVQDFSAAYALARRFEDCEGRRVAGEPGVDGEQRSLVRELVHLPRDVARFLFEIVSALPVSDGARRFPRDRRRLAALGFGRGLLLDPNVPHWFLDRERLGLMGEALDEFVRRFTADSTAAAAGHFMSAFLHYQAANWRRLRDRLKRSETLEGMKRGFTHLAEAVKHLDVAATEGNLPDDDEHCHRLWTVCATDYFISMLAHVRGEGSAAGDALLAARRAIAGLPIEREPKAATTAWMRAAIERYCDAPSHEQGLIGFEKLDAELQAFASGDERLWGPRWLARRRATLAEHFVGTWGQALERGEPTAEAKAHVREWAERARVRVERIARAMVGKQWDDTDETMATPAQAYGDVAWRSSSEFEMLALMWRPGLDLAETRRLALDLLEAHGRQEVGWRVARNSLEPGERLVVLFRRALPAQALGAALHEMAMLASAPDANQAKGALVRSAERLLKEFRTLGEAHPRIPRERDAPEQLYAEIEEVIGSVAQMVVDLCRVLR